MENKNISCLCRKLNPTQSSPYLVAIPNTLRQLTIIIIIIIIWMSLCHRPFLPGTSLQPAVIPAAQASSFTLQYFPYYVWCSNYYYYYYYWRLLVLWQATIIFSRNYTASFISRLFILVTEWDYYFFGPVLAPRFCVLYAPCSTVFSASARNSQRPVFLSLALSVSPPDIKMWTCECSLRHTSVL